MTVENAGTFVTGIDFDDVYDYYTKTGTPLMTPVGIMQLLFYDDPQLLAQQ